MRIVALMFGLGLLAVGCARPMRLEASSWNVARTDGSAIRAYTVTDKSLSDDSYDSVALCVTPADRDPTEALENLAGACAAGCRILLVDTAGPDTNRVNDHLAVLRRYLESAHRPPQSVIVIGVRGGSEVAAAVAHQAHQTSHLVLLGPTTVNDAATGFCGPVFVALTGDVFATVQPPEHVTVKKYPPIDQDWREVKTGRTIRPLIEMDLLDWFVKTEALTSDHARSLAKRVRAAHREWYE